MGSGKTTVGKKMANGLSYDYFDLDHFIEQKEKKSVRKIFEIMGEAYFREQESKYLRTISDDKNCVISTGGGLPCYNNNMDYMNNNGLTVYLKMKPEHLFSRLKNGRKNRPLIKDKNDQELFQYIVDKLNEREFFYQKSRVVVDGFNLNMNDLLEKIRSYITQ